MCPLIVVVVPKELNILLLPEYGNYVLIKTLAWMLKVNSNGKVSWFESNLLLISEANST